MILPEIIINFFLNNTFLFSPIAGFLSEDIFLFLIVFVSANGINFSKLIFIGFLGLIGMIFHDIILYNLTNLNIINKLSHKFNLSKNSLISFVNKFGKGHYFIPLVFSKFIYGVRTAVVIFVSRKEKKFKSFLFFNSFANLIWILIMLPIGWFTGRGFSFLFETAQSIERVFAIGFVIILIIYIVSKLFKRKAKILEKSNLTQTQA